MGIRLSMVLFLLLSSISFSGCDQLRESVAIEAEQSRERGRWIRSAASEVLERRERFSSDEVQLLGIEFTTLTYNVIMMANLRLEMLNRIPEETRLRDQEVLDCIEQNEALRDRAERHRESFTYHLEGVETNLSTASGYIESVRDSEHASLESYAGFFDSAMERVDNHITAILEVEELILALSEQDDQQRAASMRLIRIRNEELGFLDEEE